MQILRERLVTMYLCCMRPRIVPPHGTGWDSLLGYFMWRGFIAGGYQLLSTLQNAQYCYLWDKRGKA